MALPTSNLRVSSIIQTLGVTNAKAIFYNSDGSLKTIEQMSVLVNKNGLDGNYCPGSTPDARIANLRADRNLKYFKGYVSLIPSLSINPTSLWLDWGVGSSGSFTIISNTEWAISKPSWCSVSVNSGSGNAEITVTTTLSNPSNTIERTGFVVVTTAGGIESSVEITQARMGT